MPGVARQPDTKGWEKPGNGQIVDFVELLLPLTIDTMGSHGFLWVLDSLCPTPYDKTSG